MSSLVSVLSSYPEEAIVASPGFHGVASRYLIHYSGWRRVLDARSLTAPAQLPAAAVKAG